MAGNVPCNAFCGGRTDSKPNSSFLPGTHQPPPLLPPHTHPWLASAPLRVADAMGRERTLEPDHRAQILAAAPPCCVTLSGFLNFPKTHQINRNKRFFLQQVFTENLLGARHRRQRSRLSEQKERQTHALSDHL